MADIKDKIKKLLALATSANENEARDALLKAKALMAKNKLAESDFMDVQEQKMVHVTCDKVTWTTDSGNIWMANLCQILCDNYLCTAAWQTVKGGRTHTLMITGMSEDADLCKSVVEYAVEFVLGAIKRLQRRYSGDPKSIATSYATGFVKGLELAFEIQQDEHPEWALVVVKPDEVRKYEDGLGSKAVRTKKAQFNALAYMNGQNDGMEFNPQKVIA